MKRADTANYFKQHLSCILEDTRDREESLNFCQETIEFELNG